MDYLTRSDPGDPRDRGRSEHLQGQVQETRISDLIASVRGLIRRRWLTLAIVSAVVFAIAAALILLITPSYEATARLRIDPSRNPLPGADRGGPDPTLSAGAIDTEVAVLGSDELIRAVVARLKLQNDPEFSKGIDEKIAEGKLARDDRLNVVADRVRSKLGVGREKQTYVIAVTFKSKSPVQAARVANAFAQTYIETRVGARVGTAQGQADFFKRELDKAAAALREADTRLAQYRAQAGIVEGGASGTIADQQVAPLSGQLADAESQAAEARSNLSVARRQAATGGIDSIAAVRGSPVISELRRQRAELIQQSGEISSRYGEKYPATIKVREQLAAVDTQIKDEANRAVATLDAQASSAEARASSLRSSLNGLENRQAQNSRAAANAKGLESDATAKRASYDRISQAYLDSLQSTRNLISNAEIVDPAQTPLTPAPPRKWVLALLALVIALVLGFATIIVQELLVGGLRTVDDVEKHLGLPLLVSIPQVKESNPADRLIKQPASMYAEALRNARASIFGVGAGDDSGHSPRLIALTSALPDEGKTTTSLALARTLAQTGTRTLLIDCDMRKARLQVVTRSSVAVGLVEVLSGTATLAEAIIADQVDGLDLLLVKDRFFSAEDLVGDGRLARLLETARGNYQHIVIDLPPVMAVADARAIAVMADAVVLVIRWGVTPMRAAKGALALLENDGAHVAGVLYNRVDTNAEAIGSLYYSAQSAAYYAEV